MEVLVIKNPEMTKNIVTPKYPFLVIKVTTWLKPSDFARRDVRRW
jgi:hypothetical protein